MLKTYSKFLLIIGVMIFGLNAAAFAAGSSDDTKKAPKNTGILSVKTTPEASIVRVDGVQVGMSGTGTANEFYLTPGTHRVEVQDSNGKIWTKDIEIRKGIRNCVCLKSNTISTSRPCPYNVRVDGPEKVIEGDLITFVATNLVPATVPLTYRWKVSPESAVITSGLGTSSITVDTKGMGTQPITAELDVTDDVYGATCMQKNSVATGVDKIVKPEPFRFDMFESKSFDDDKARFDNYTIQVQSVPDSQAYIVMYQGTDAASVKRGDVDKLSKRALDYLVTNKGLDPSRIMITKWGTKEKTTYELWIVPPGAQPPVPQ